MNEHEAVRQLLEEIAEETVPEGSVSLAAGVKSGYLAAHRRAHRDRQGWRWALGAAAGLAAVIGALMAAPTTRATLDQTFEDLLRRMGLDLAPASETNDTTVGLAEPTTIAVTPVIVPVEELRARAPFPVRLPAWLPEGVVYQTGLISDKAGTGSVVVVLDYHRAGDPPGPDAPTLRLEMTPGDLPPFYLSDEAAQPVEVNGQPGVYIHGSWTTEKPLQPGETANGLFWDYAADVEYLTWIEGGIACRIHAYGLGLELEDLLKIAESLR